MATASRDLSAYDPQQVPDGSGMTIGIVVAAWNEKVTSRLLEGARNTLLNNGLPENNIPIKVVPGSFELPVAAQYFTDQDNIDAVICLGSLIRGETLHFEVIAHSVARAIQEVNLRSGKPVIFGVLTDNNEEQALARSGGKHGNKGDEAAIAALRMVSILQ